MHGCLSRAWQSAVGWRGYELLASRLRLHTGIVDRCLRQFLNCDLVRETIRCFRGIATRLRHLMLQCGALCDDTRRWLLLCNDCPILRRGVSADTRNTEGSELLIA